MTGSAILFAVSSVLTVALACGAPSARAVPPTPAEPTAADPPEPQGVCPADAKLCPDGTAVSRQGPRCEFAPCPAPKPSANASDLAPCKSAEGCTGPRMLAPNFKCSDGSMGGPMCADIGGGKCAWRMRSCP